MQRGYKPRICSVDSAFSTLENHVAKRSFLPAVNRELIVFSSNSKIIWNYILTKFIASWVVQYHF